jgi:hypothetical protein
MDYMSSFPSTKHGHDFVFVVVDRFSKMDILAPCKNTITTKAIASLLLEHVWVHFGLPHTIVSYCDNRFLSVRY